MRAVGNGLELPHVAEFCADGRPGGTATLNAQTACCGPPVGRRPARATRWVTESAHSSSARPPRTANASLLALSLSGSKPAGPKATSVAGLRSGRLRPARLCEPQKQQSIHLLNSFGFILDHNSSSPPAESSNELRRVAARRKGWRQTARLYEPQELSPNPSPILSPARPKARPISPPCVLTAAPLSLRRVFARLARFILFRLTAEIVESLL